MLAGKVELAVWAVALPPSLRMFLVLTTKQAANSPGQCLCPTTRQPSKWQRQSAEATGIFEESVEQCTDIEGLYQGVVGLGQFRDACGPCNLSAYLALVVTLEPPGLQTNLSFSHFVFPPLPTI